MSYWGASNGAARRIHLFGVVQRRRRINHGKSLPLNNEKRRFGGLI
jgi:hypothetical protein